MKNIEKKLRDAVIISQEEEQFPNYLAERVLNIAENIEQYQNARSMLTHLIFMILDYNMYAETCCEKIGTSHFDIENMLAKISEAVKE
jgi:hypothetical protein